LSRRPDGKRRRQYRLGAGEIDRSKRASSCPAACQISPSTCLERDAVISQLDEATKALSAAAIDLLIPT
jgi:hypothetical protein